MLPVATPPNAIVFSAAKMDPVEMVNNSRHLLVINLCLIERVSTDEIRLVHEHRLRHCHLRLDGDVG